MSCNAIEVKGVSKIFFQYAKPWDRLRQFLWRGKKRFYEPYLALQALDFCLTKGTVLGIVGENGAGKSTLLQLICGTMQPTEGEVIVHGRISALLELGSGFNPDFTGRENVFLNASILGLSQAEITQKYDDIVAFADIGDFVNQPVKTYSSGMLVRLAFAVATSIDPDILIVDEALSVGDGAFARKSFERIMALKERGCTILFCSHSLYQVESLCDAVLWLRKGRMMALDTPDKVLPDYQSFLDAKSQTSDSAPHLESFIHNEVALSEKMVTPKGYARIRSMQFWIDDSQTHPLVAVSGKSCLKINVNFVSDITLPTPGVAVTISSQDGRILASAGTWNEAVNVERNALGLSSVWISFPNIALLKGRYKIGIYLYCEKGLHNYEWADPAAEFSVTQTDREQGIVRLTHYWSKGESH